MIGDPPQPPAVVAVVLVLLAGHFRCRFDDREQIVDVKVRRHTLQHTRGSLQTHAGIDVLARQRVQIVGRIADAIELREDQVPDLDIAAVVQVKVDLAAGTADTIGTLARRRGGPEVLVLVHPRDAGIRQTDLVLPDSVGFVVVLVDRHAEPIAARCQAISCRSETPKPSGSPPL